MTSHNKSQLLLYPFVFNLHLNWFASFPFAHPRADTPACLFGVPAMMMNIVSHILLSKQSPFVSIDFVSKHDFCFLTHGKKFNFA